MAIKRLLAFSDTHGNISSLETLIKWAVNSYGDPESDNAIDAAVFLGDGIEDLEHCPSGIMLPCECITIRGNSEYAPSVPESRVLDFGGHRFFLCHGHRYNLHDGYDLITAAARNTESDAVLFGHIHVPVFQDMDGTMLVCPGSIGKPRSRIGSTFAIIDCIPGSPIDVHFWGVNSQVCKPLMLEA